MDHEFSVMEDAVLGALAPLKNEGLRELDLYVGQLDVDDMKEVTARFPCIFVIAGVLDVPPNEQRKRAGLTLTLIIGDRNRRSHTATVRGDSSSPGVYHLLARCRDLLHAKKIVPGWRTFRVRTEAPLMYAPKQRICLFEAVYDTEI